MATPDFSDIEELAKKDKDIDDLIIALKKVLYKRGVSLITRIVASVIYYRKRRNFEERLEVKEYAGLKYAGVPSDLADKDVAIDHNTAESLDHPILWQHSGKLVYLTSEPYFVSKDSLKGLIAHCDLYGIDFQIDAESCYYPGHTVRILFKKGQISQYDALQQRSDEYE